MVGTMTEQHKRPTAYSYLRFSTPEQAKGDSQRRQSEAAKKYALDHSLNLMDVSYQDLGVSAFRSANAETGMLGEFLDAVRSGVVERGSWLLIESLDRLSRARPRKAVRLLESICEEKITLVTLADGKVYTEALLDEEPMAFMWAFMVAIRANEESETKSKRLKAVWSQKRKTADKRILTAKAPSWLRLTEDRSRFDVLDEKAAVVRQIYEDFATGVGYGKIAETLNRDRVPTFEGAQMWHRSFVTKLLQGSTPVGTYTPSILKHEDGKKTRVPTDPVKGYYPAVVSEELNDAVKIRLSVPSQRGRHAKAGTVQNLLANLCRCPRCGGSVTLVNKGARDKKKLVCAKAKAGAGCTYTSVAYSDIESTLVDHRDQWLLLDLMPVHPLDATLTELDELIVWTKSRITTLMGLSSSVTRLELQRLDEELAAHEETQRELIETMEQTAPAAVEMRAELVREELQKTTLDRVKVNTLLKQLLTHATIGFDDGFLRLNWRHQAPETRLMFQWVAGVD